MARLGVEGDFSSAFNEFLDNILVSDTASFETNQIGFSTTDPTTGVVTFSAGFEGIFDTGNNTGNITDIVGEMVEIQPGGPTPKWNFEFSEVSIAFDTIFDVGDDSFTYFEAGVIQGVANQDYVVEASAGKDKVAGNSSFSFSGDDEFNMLGGNDVAKAGLGDDTVNGGAGKDRLFGGSGDDTLNGGSGKDVLMGGNGKDVLNGGGGNDTLNGGNGADTLTGGNGMDRLAGKTGKDFMTGNGGSDVFEFGTDAKIDVVTDFEDGIDQIQLNNGTAFGDLALSTRDSGVLVTDGDFRLLLQDMTIDQVDSGDFLA